MRVVVRVLGVVVGVVGLVVLVTGAAAAAWVGPDDTVDLRTGDVRTEGVAVATQPGLLSRFGPTLHVRARTQTAQPVWVGVAHEGDLDSYVAGRSRTEVARVTRSGGLVLEPVPGVQTGLGTPGDREWWVAHEVGPTATLDWPTTDGHYGVVVLRADGKPGLAVDLTVGASLPGLFTTVLLVAGAGLVLLVLGGLTVWLSRRRPTVAAAGVPW